jgi:hypothetical protein
MELGSFPFQNQHVLLLLFKVGPYVTEEQVLLYTLSENEFSQLKKKIEKIMWIIDYYIINIKKYLNFKRKLKKID